MRPYITRMTLVLTAGSYITGQVLLADGGMVPH
jgi:hypothetical protein